MDTLRAAPPLRVGDVALVLVERAEILSDSGDAGYWIGAFKAPFAVIVCDAGGVQAFAPDSSEIALDALTAEIPNLAAILSGLSAS